MAPRKVLIRTLQLLLFMSMFIQSFAPPPLSCDKAGEVGFTARIQRSITFKLCAQSSGDLACEKCRCEWASYWEAAELCFPSINPKLTRGQQYEERVKEQQQSWLTDLTDKCGVEPVTYATPQWLATAEKNLQPTEGRINCLSLAITVGPGVISFATLLLSLVFL